MMNLDYCIFLLFVISLIFHLFVTLFNKIKSTHSCGPNEFNEFNEFNEYQEYCQIEELPKSIFEIKINMQYVLFVIGLIMFDQQKLMLMYSIIIYYIKYNNSVSNFGQTNYVINNNVATLCFSCLWLSICSLFYTDNNFAPYLLLVLSLFIDDIN